MFYHTTRLLFVVNLLNRVSVYNKHSVTLGSLANLGKEFASHVQLKKGHFPHLFNTVDNYDYVGPIPDKKFFDVHFIHKNEKQKQEFDEWYESQEERIDWNFMEELMAYCRNDVLILAEIVKRYNAIAQEMSKFYPGDEGISPLRNATAPSFVHEAFLRQRLREYELPDPKEEPDVYFAKVEQLAKESEWAVQTSFEYFFVRKALRGGRTDVRCLYMKITPEEWAQGIRIRYQDVMSMYPYHQMSKQFPVGLPTIHVWDEDFYLCTVHPHNPDVLCDCPLEKKRRRPKNEKFVDYTNYPQPTQEQVLNEWGEGFACVTLDPPNNLYHPVLSIFDEKKNKATAHLIKELHKKIFVTTIELKTALRNGYRLLKVHRFDEYKMADSKWVDILGNFIVQKLINSKDQPCREVLEEMYKGWDRKFPGMGEKLRKQEGKWQKRPAFKLTAKTLCNCGWGKHAQRPIQEETNVFDFTKDYDRYEELFLNHDKGNIELKDLAPCGNYVMTKHLNKKAVAPDLHNLYLPAACFVPAYGRMQLWEQMNKLGDRVLMNDTDSIVYKYIPWLYNIPEGTILGDWEIEDVDKEHGGIVEFVGLCPKTYAFKCADGYTVVKAKGISINLMNSTILNFDTMKKLALDHIEGRDPSPLMIPQQTFNFSFEKSMTTYRNWKDLTIRESELKGYLVGNYLYPFGYEQ